MKKGHLLIVLLFVFFSANSFGQGWEWMKGSQNGESHGLRVATDGHGSVYAAGLCWFKGNFGPYPYSVDGLAYMPLVKYDSSGKIQWLLMASHSAPCGLATDNFGNEYILCSYSDPIVDFAGHTVKNPCKDSNSYFIAKVNSQGSVIWMKNIGNINSSFTYGYQIGNCVATDDCGNVYTACLYINRDMNIGGVFFPNSGTGSIPSPDILVTKFDSTGNIIWSRSFGGNGNDWPSGLIVTSSGDIYMAGLFKSDSLIFGKSLLLNTFLSRNYWNTFLVKLDNSGNSIWAKATSGSVDCEPYGLAIDNIGNVFITGCYGVGYHPPATVSFGGVTLPAVPSFQEYGFVVKYDGNGNSVWGKCIKGKYVVPYGVTTDPCNNVWMFATNLTTDRNTAIFDTIDGNIVPAPPINNNPVFISGWNNSGGYIATSALAGGANSDAISIASDRSGNIFITCHADLDTFFVAGDSLYNTTGPVYMGHPYNMYVAKYNPNLSCPYRSIPHPNCKLGIEEFPEEVDIKLYPNPANSECTITYPGTTYTAANISIYDVTGRLMHTYPLAESSTTVSIADLLPGIYHCRIDVNGNGAVSKKLVVIR